MSYLSQPSKIDNLLILRGLCALGVLLVHATNDPWLFSNNLDLKAVLHASGIGGIKQIFYGRQRAQIL